MDDHELVERLLCGVPGSAEEFVERFERPLWRLLVGSLDLQPDVAGDVLQEFFTRLWASEFELLRRWRGESSLCTYLVVCVRRAAFDTLRAGRRRTRGAEPLGPGEDEHADERETPEEDALAAERRTCLARAREQLSPNDGRLIALRHDQGCSYTQIAEAMGWTVNHVGVALGRAEHRLAGLLDRMYPGLFAGRGRRDRV